MLLLYSIILYLIIALLPQREKKPNIKTTFYLFHCLNCHQKLHSSRHKTQQPNEANMRPSTTKHSNSRRGVGGNLSHPPPQRTITPSSTAGKKRQGGSDSSGSGSGSVGRNNKRQKVDIMDLDPIFPTLDQSDPVHARRIQQRRKMVQMGKNTAGYFEYTKKVPKEKRRPRSMDTPSTPDHTLDIPTKRWQGMIKAWYVDLFLLYIYMCFLHWPVNL